MADIRCPMCGKSNPEDLELCQFCGARLKPLAASTPAEGDQAFPDKYSTSDKPPEQEPTIPDWLGNLRKDSDAVAGEFTEDGTFERDLSGEIAPSFSSPSSSEIPDRLAGLGKSASDEEEEIPDWLASLREEKTGTSDTDSAPAEEPHRMVTGSLSSNSNAADWMARLGSESQPDEKPKEGTETPESTPRAEEKPDLLSNLSGSTEDNLPAFDQGGNLPVRADQPKEKPADSVPVHREEEGAAYTPTIPDWLPSLASESGTPKGTQGDNLPEGLSDQETKPAEVPAASVPTSDLPASTGARQEIPEWLSQLKSDTGAAAEQEAKKEQFQVTPPPSPQKEEAGPLPNWLAGIKQSETPSGGTPAFIPGGEDTTVGDKKDAPVSVEIPDWLSKLKPEKPVENVPKEEESAASTPENLEVSELPTWVQAMRPVESVIDKATEIPREDAHVAEQSGPLAGLQGVLPAGPGLGPLRKPPAYSTILQVTEGQQRYATAFEQLISNETLPQVAGRTHLASNRLWRWLISALLILAVVLPLTIGMPVTQASQLRPPEMVNAFTSIGNLPPGAPVLLIFDYDPALYGEMEAAAAPLMDQLMLQGPRFSMISTNPTGPVLAEQFLKDTSAFLLVAGQQYVNLGYLAGGPSGVQYFAISPAEAAPFTMDGQQAWQLPPLQGIQKLSDFSAIIVLTDNADSGRVWIEQTGSMIGNTPMLMVISAQAEPLILPYYDSGQIKGLVTGLAGGEAYGQASIYSNTQSGLASRYWNSFSAGTVVAEILIVIGALLSAFAGRRARHEKSVGGV